MWIRIRSITLLCCAILLSFSAGACHIGNIRPDERPFTLTVIHLNDTHSHIESDELLISLGRNNEFIRIKAGSFTRIPTRIAQIRRDKANTILLHAGDAVRGTIYDAIYEGDADVDFLNLLGVDVMACGNHEFDRGAETFAKFIDRARFPIITANADLSHNPFLTGKTAPYVIREVSGDRIGIIGLITEDCPRISQPDPDIVFNNIEAAARQYVSLLENMGINKIILLTHIGYEADMALAHSVPGIDLIVGGHSHTLLGNFGRLGLTPIGDYPMVVKRGNGDTTLVVHAWQWGHVLGQIDVDFDSRGRVTAWHGKPVIISGESFHNAAGAELTGKKLKRVKRAIAADLLIDIVEENQEAGALLDFYRRGLPVP